MSSKKTGESDRRYSDICGATNSNGEACKLPAGWGTPGTQGGRCKFHGGASTGPDNTEYLEGNDFAEDNSGGGAPEGNTNARIHGGFSDWRKAYGRFEGDTKAYVDRLIADMRETAREHAPEIDADRRERLLKEKATLSILWRRASADTFGTPDDSGSGPRGVVIEEQQEINGECYTVAKANPAWDATFAISARRREIAKGLRLWPGLQDE